ncbi:hypothetical protein RHA1_ro03150 [Rhodococcus jostii RHA1]|uniref:Uncharacterized protein n=1 Tax=Rhodococcus jostii (strain RHA1) TaxID=101510 RepID=Q0SBY3_RHOJR|nr:hypothetical protein RHA1_ro03150 [Rhodococcus jostii RHA1]
MDATSGSTPSAPVAQLVPARRVDPAGLRDARRGVTRSPVRASTTPAISSEDRSPFDTTPPPSSDASSLNFFIGYHLLLLESF